MLFSWQEFWGLSEVQSMCNLGTAIENKGIETGIEIGEKKKAKEQTFIGQLLCCDYMIP